MSPVKNDATKYAKSLVEFALRLNEWDLDREYERKGGTIIYAVDVDMVVSYSNPEKRFRYASVMSDDSDEVRKILSRAICGYIFSSLANKNPLVLIPPHTSEVESVLKSTLLKTFERGIDIIRDINNVNVNKIKEIIDNYKKYKDVEKTVDSLEREVVEFVRLIYDGGVNILSRLDRMTSLIESNKIMHIDNYCVEKDKKKWVFPEIYDDIKIEDYSCLTKETHEWLRIIKSKKSIKRPYKSIINDLEALSRIKIINERIADQNKRLVLITGDRSLREATEDIQIDNNNTFADLYIRDPRSFMANPEFVNPDQIIKANIVQEISDSLSDWLDVGFTGITLDYYKEKRRYLKELINDDGKLEYCAKGIYNKRKERKDKWEKYVKIAALNYGIDRSERVDISTMMSQVSKADIEKLKTSICNRFFEVWLQFWKVSTEAGYFTVRKITELNSKKQHAEEFNIPIRGIPVLRISLPVAQNEMHKLCKGLMHDNVLKEIKKFDKLRDEDETGYTAFLLYALAFGAAGQWNISTKLSELALSIAKNIDESHQPPGGYECITGNEAAYLLSWSIRHSAMSFNDLDRAKKYLNMAKKLLDKIPDVKDDNYRYESEYIGLKMTEILFQYFMQNDIYIFKPKQNLIKCNETIIKILSKNVFKKHIEYILLDKISESDSQDYSFVMNLMIIKQLVTNLFVSDVFLKFKENDKQSKEKMQIMRYYYNLFKKVCEMKGFRTKTCMTKSFYLISSLVYDKDNFRKNMNSAKSYFYDKDLERCYSQPYDVQLYNFMRDCLVFLEEEFNI